MAKPHRTITMKSLTTAWPAVPLTPIKGRGAVSNPQGRFESLQRIQADDGWQPSCCSADDPLSPAGDAETIATVLADHQVGKAISINQSPDIFFNRAVNPYRGCEHGCIYCYARPGHAFEGMSPGLDFETKIVARHNLPEQLGIELDAPAYSRRPIEPITIGSFTDPYQPIERDLQITRNTIKTLIDRQHPFSIVTKGSLIERDIDLLAPAASLGLVSCYVSVTTLDPDLARRFEPRAPAPFRRLLAIERLASHGIPVGVMAAPMIPFINDCDLEKILARAAQAGARSAHYTVVRLPHEVKGIFQDWLTAHFPDRSARVMNRIRDLRAGKLNDPRFHSRMRGTGPWADLIAQRFSKTCRRYGLSRKRAELNRQRFTPLSRRDQMTLF